MICVYLRFVSADIDPESRVEAGVFVAAHGLYESGRLPDYEGERLGRLIEWFDLNLKRPDRFTKSSRRGAPSRGVCWFKPTARVHLAQIHEMVAILEENDVLIWRIKAPKVGYVVYEDEHQVVAEPYADTRR